jgi:TRAP-type C4-dicarboxylate transport system substrate-binding protein
MTGHVYSPTCVMISDEFFETLPEDLREIILESVAEVRPAAREMVEKQEEELLGQLKEKGMIVNDVDTTEFRKLMQPLYDSFIEASGAEGEAYLKRIQENLR